MPGLGGGSGMIDGIFIVVIIAMFGLCAWFAYSLERI